MKNHLTIEDLHVIINDDSENIISKFQNHLTGCARCRFQLEEQKNIHNNLLVLEPLKVDSAIQKNVITQVKKYILFERTEKPDWVFLISLVVLFGLAAWSLINSEAFVFATEIINQTPFLSDTAEQVSVTSFYLRKIFQSLKIQNTTMYPALGIIASIFYLWLNKKISKKINYRR